MSTTSTSISEHIEQALNNWLPEVLTAPGLLHEAMRYSIFAGGKRLRPRLVVASTQSTGGDFRRALPAAIALEMIHTYSLIHDDLPAMDDDDLRRGQPTNHKVFGEDIAILAGDGLLTEAFYVISKHVDNPIVCQKLVQVISKAAGAAGMVGGQVADIKSSDKEGSLELLKFIHGRKTAALISASCEAGAICSEADDETCKRYASLGYSLGIAFQIIDDILDETEDTATLGKTAGKDKEQNKVTYPSVVGIERAKKMADAYAQEALDALIPDGNSADNLRELIHLVVSRSN